MVGCKFSFKKNKLNMKNFITTMTPMRISFIGGGTDLKDFYKFNNDGGAVISAAINKYVYIILNKYHDKHRCLLKYSKSEIVKNIKDIKHPLIKACLEKSNLWGLDINSVADIPAGTGLGSSSSIAVGLINALQYYKNKSISKKTLADKACEIEIDILKQPIGKQDQYAATYGGLNIIKFRPNGNTLVERITNKKVINFLKENLIIINTGMRKDNNIVLREQKKNIKKGKIFFEHLRFMKNSVFDFKSALLKRDIKVCGEILHENWMKKKELAKRIANKNINEIYEDALTSGALGGKILGAGGRGYLMLICPKTKQKDILKKFKKFEFLNFEFDKFGSRRLIRI